MLFLARRKRMDLQIIRADYQEEEEDPDQQGDQESQEEDAEADADCGEDCGEDDEADTDCGAGDSTQQDKVVPPGPLNYAFNNALRDQTSHGYCSNPGTRDLVEAPSTRR